MKIKELITETISKREKRMMEAKAGQTIENPHVQQFVGKGQKQTTGGSNKPALPWNYIPNIDLMQMVVNTIADYPDLWRAAYYNAKETYGPNFTRDWEKAFKYATQEAHSEYHDVTSYYSTIKKLFAGLEGMGVDPSIISNGFGATVALMLWDHMTPYKKDNAYNRADRVVRSDHSTIDRLSRGGNPLSILLLVANTVFSKIKETESQHLQDIERGKRPSKTVDQELSQTLAGKQSELKLNDLDGKYSRQVTQVSDEPKSVAPSSKGYKADTVQSIKPK